MGRLGLKFVVLMGVSMVVAGACASVALAAPPQVRVGAAPRLAAGSKVLGSLASDTRIGAVVTLESRDPAALAAYATAVATPGSSVYHRYLTVPQFAQKFGATPAAISAVEASLRADGLSPGAATANGLSIPITATAGQLARAFSTTFERVALAGGRTAFANTTAPALDANVAGRVQAVLGLDTVSRFHPLGVHAAARRADSAAAPHVVTGGPQPCAAAVTDGGKYGAYTADQLASAYKFSSQYGAGDLGAGQTVAIFELEPNLTTDISAYQACYGTSTSVSYVTVDGGAGTGAGEGEAALDIEDILGLAPAASIDVYQAPNTDAGYIDEYTQIITTNTAKVISTSWGLCEKDDGFTGSAGAEAESTLFQEAATQGQSLFAAMGDDGSEDCYRVNNSKDTSLAVDDPGSQPYVTGVGGTSLSATGPPPTETVWNDGGSAGGGGGGISSFWAMPSYQLGAPASLNVINTNSSKTPCSAHVTAGSYCREDPDVSADADENTGYVVYYNGGWTAIGGTSAAAPLWAAFTALADASSACHGTPIGFANPALYRVAGTSLYASAFNDITTGNNDVYAAHSGLFPAGTAYDMASGLGTPIASTLAGYLCDQVTVASPGAQAAYTTTPVSLPGTGASTDGLTLAYTASGLPAGLSINPATGAVSGTPTTVGTSSVTISASDADGAAGSTSFSWTVFTTVVGVTGPGNQTGTIGVPVALQIHGAANNHGALAYSATGLPAGLTINAASGVISGTPTAAGSSTVTVTATDVTGPSGTASFPWVIAVPESVSHPAFSGLGTGKPGLSFSVNSVAGSPLITTIAIKLPKGLSFSGKAKNLAKGVTLKGPGNKTVKFAAKVSHGVLTLKLKTAEPSVKVSISHRDLTETKSLQKKIKKKHIKSLAILVTATNAGHITTAIAATLKV